MALKGRRKTIIGLPYAWNGLKALMKSERNFKIHVLMATIVIGLGIFVQLSMFEWIIVCLVIGMVLISEGINTAIELIIDYLKPEKHPTAKLIKDIAAGTVLISAIVAIVIGSLIFIPKLLEIAR